MTTRATTRSHINSKRDILRTSPSNKVLASVPTEVYNVRNRCK